MLAWTADVALQLCSVHYTNAGTTLLQGYADPMVTYD